MPRRSKPVSAISGFAALCVLVGGLTACDTDDGRSMVPPDDSQRANQPTTPPSTTTTLVPSVGELPPEPVAEPFVVTAPWTSGGEIDARYTCDGDGLSPTLRWSAPPAGTVELALIVSDDNAPDFVHWAVAGIAPAAGEVTESATIDGAIEGRNGAGGTGWTPPCPPTSGEAHTYRVTLYALGQESELAEGFTGLELSTLGFDTSLEAAEVIGSYQRAATAAGPTTLLPSSTPTSVPTVSSTS